VAMGLFVLSSLLSYAILPFMAYGRCLPFSPPTHTSLEPRLLHHACHRMGRCGEGRQKKKERISNTMKTLGFISLHPTQPPDIYTLNTPFIYRDRLGFFYDFVPHPTRKITSMDTLAPFIAYYVLT
jgi:hypothetical protein